MKKLSIFLSLVFLLTACNYTAYQPLASPQEPSGISSRYLNIGLPAHNREVDVFLPSESLPDTMVLPIRLIEETSEYNGYENLIGNMKKTAQAQGLDGIIILERELINSVSDGYSTTWQVATGIGFIYGETLSMVEAFPRMKYYEVRDSGVWKKVATSELSTFGKVINTELEQDGALQQVYNQSIAPFDVDVLQSKGGKNWLQKTSRSANMGFHERIFLKRVYSAGGVTVDLDEVHLYYKDERYQQPVKINHRFSPNPKSLYVYDMPEYAYTLSYNEDGGLKEVVIREADAKKNSPDFMIQRRSFSKDKRIENEIWYKIEEGKEVPHVRIRYDYYSPEDFLPSLRFAPDIPMRASANAPSKG